MVDVRAYTKRDGTQVGAHTRGAPVVGGGLGLIIGLVLLYGAANGQVRITVPASVTVPQHSAVSHSSTGVR